MHTMKTAHAVVALGAALLAFQSPAQEPRQGVAQLRDVHGNVLLSRESGLAAGRETARLVEGTRVITTANSDVVVVYDNGCEVRLKENQRFEVEVGKPCAALVAQAQSILLEPAGAALATGATGFLAVVATLPAVGGAAIGLKILQDARESTPVSPS